MSKNRNNPGFAGRSSNGAPAVDPAALAAQREAEQEAAAAESGKVEETDVTESTDALPVDLPPGEEHKADADKVALNAAASVELPATPVAQPEVKEVMPAAVIEGVTSPAASEAAVTSPAPIRTILAISQAVEAKRQETPVVLVNPVHEQAAEFSALMLKEKKQGTPTAIRLVNFLEDYVVKMAPKRSMTDKDILKYQESLFAKITEVVENAPSLEFNRLWAILIAYFKEYKSHCFSPVYSTRGSREWSRPLAQFVLFTQLLNLLMASATDRSSDVKLNDSFEGLSSEGRGRITLYYEGQGQRRRS